MRISSIEIIKTEKLVLEQGCKLGETAVYWQPYRPFYSKAKATKPKISPKY
jgi:hypothetical protein